MLDISQFHKLDSLAKFRSRTHTKTVRLSKLRWTKYAKLKHLISATERTHKLLDYPSSDGPYAKLKYLISVTERTHKLLDFLSSDGPNTSN